jgi:hypothetical protein
LGGAHDARAGAVERRPPPDRKGRPVVARLKSEQELLCPCCGAILVLDTNLGRIVSHREPERGDKPELSDAHRILAAEAARREALFEDSVQAEKGRGDALARRFEEALRQANDEPISRPRRDFDLD